MAYLNAVIKVFLLPREWRSRRIRSVDISEDDTCPQFFARYQYIVRKESGATEPPLQNLIAGCSGKASTKLGAKGLFTFRNPGVLLGTVISDIRTRLPVRTGCEQGRPLGPTGACETLSCSPSASTREALPPYLSRTRTRLTFSAELYWMEARVSIPFSHGDPIRGPIDTSSPGALTSVHCTALWRVPNFRGGEETDQGLYTGLE